MSDQLLYVDSIFEFENRNDSPCVVYITMPNRKPEVYKEPFLGLTGLMAGDPTWNASNQWGPIVNDVSNLIDVSSLVGSASLFSWIGASTMCWKGTNPLNIGIEFYLINYSPYLMLEDKLKEFVKMASLAQSNKASEVTVIAHGGYAADIFQTNTSFFDDANKVRRVDDLVGLGGGPDINSLGKDAFNGGDSEPGTLQLQFGHKSKIKNLLLHKVSVTESTAEVADSKGGNKKPLYYRVNAQFTGVRPLLTTDVDYMFSGY